MAKKKLTINGCIFNLYAGSNNTIISLTDANGNLLGKSFTPPTLGNKHCRKKSPFSIKATITEAIKFLKSIGVQEVELHVEGWGPARDAYLTVWDQSIRIKRIVDNTSRPYNGPTRPNPRSGS